MHVIAAKAVAFKEALDPSFKEYAKQIVKNCATLADELIKRGYKLVSNGTDNHLILVDIYGSVVGYGMAVLNDAVLLCASCPTVCGGIGTVSLYPVKYRHHAEWQLV